MQHIVQPGVGEAEVEEARPRDLDRDHMRGRRGGELVGELLGELAGVASGSLGGGERDVRRPVAVLASRRPLEVDRVGQRVDRQRDERVTHGCSELIANHVVLSVGRPAVARRAARAGPWIVPIAAPAMITFPGCGLGDSPGREVRTRPEVCRSESAPNIPTAGTDGQAVATRTGRCATETPTFTSGPTPDQMTSPVISIAPKRSSSAPMSTWTSFLARLAPRQ